MIIHSSADGHTGWFYLLAIVTNTVMNRGVQYLFQFLLLILLGCVYGTSLTCPRSRTRNG